MVIFSGIVVVLRIKRSQRRSPTDTLACSVDLTPTTTTTTISLEKLAAIEHHRLHRIPKNPRIQRRNYQRRKNLFPYLAALTMIVMTVMVTFLAMMFRLTPWQVLKQTLKARNQKRNPALEEADCSAAIAIAMMAGSSEVVSLHNLRKRLKANQLPPKLASLLP